MKKEIVMSIMLTCAGAVELVAQVQEEQSALIAAYENMLPTLLRFKHNIAQAVEAV